MPAIRVTPENVQVTVTSEVECVSPDVSFRIPGVPTDEEDLEQFVSAVEEMVDEHGLWGWCQVVVRAKFCRFVGESYLGGCSYKDEDDFKRGGYYEQMVREAIEDLQQQIDGAYRLIHVE